MDISLYTDALVSNSFRCRQSRAGSSKRIKNHSFTKRQNSTHDLS